MINLSEVCKNLPPTAHIVLWVGFFLWEHGLGKTRFGSSIGLFVTKPGSAIINKLKGTK